ncbi:MAG: hypothetical protein MAG431_00071 [Chloroflexi bacterium]|nr:hypothetical protein [Chloroflexota bacterium]
MAFVIKINGSNYKSDGTRSSFEEALEDGYQVSSLKGQHDQGDMQHETTPPPSTSSEWAGNGASQAEPQVETPAYTRLLGSIEQGLAHSFDHQKQTLHVHEQYLANQGEYSKIFLELMKQQKGFLEGGYTTAEEMQIALAMLEKVSQSIDQFHDHQGETLRVHHSFLDHQAEYAQEYINILQRGSMDGIPQSSPVSPALARIALTPAPQPPSPPAPLLPSTPAPQHPSTPAP